MKIGCGSVVYREHDIKKSLESIRNIGFAYFETQSTNPWCNHVIIEKDDPVKFSLVAKEIGFKGITALWTNDGTLISVSDKCTDTIKRTIEWAAAASIPVVNFGDGSKPFEMNKDFNCLPLGKGIVNLKGCIDILKEYGYKGAVSLETEGGMDFTSTEALAKESFEYMKKIIL